MTHNELIEIITVDAKIDRSDLGNESLKIPVLHAKYLKLLREEKQVLNKMQMDLQALTHRKSEYYMGKGTIEEYNRKPLNLKVLKGDLTRYVEADEEVMEMSMRVSDQNDKILTINEMIKSINNRNFLIKSAIDWLKFTQGSF